MSKDVMAKNLPLSIAIYGLDVCSKDEKMYESLNKVPNLIRTCILIVIEHFKETGLLDKANDDVAEIVKGIDFSKCESNKERLGMFLQELSDVMKKAEVEAEKEGD